MLKDICLIEIDIPGALFGAEVQKDIPRRRLQVQSLYKIENQYIYVPVYFGYDCHDEASIFHKSITDFTKNEYIKYYIYYFI